MHISTTCRSTGCEAPACVTSSTCALLRQIHRTSVGRHSFKVATQRRTACVRATHSPELTSQSPLPASDSCHNATFSSRDGRDEGAPAPSSVSRRSALLAPLGIAIVAAAAGQPAEAIQGLTAGRVPGISGAADADGFLQYQRPMGKSGGHGVGWSEIPRYKFKVPAGWEETPVSIADLGGTEIDLRYGNSKQGELSVVVAPVLRFLDIGFNANIKIEDVGPPGKLINGFAPELFGGPLNDEDVVSTATVMKDGRSYYEWVLDFKRDARPHHLVSATAVGNRVFLMSIAASARQWRAAEPKLRTIQESFYVPGPRN